MDTSENQFFRTIEYEDELNEEFSGIRRETICIDEKYRYLSKNPFVKILEFFVYRVVMTPIAFLWCKLKFRYRVVNKKVFKKVKKTGYFVFGNHTLMAGDAFFPSLISFPRKTKVVVNADNLSLPYPVRRWVELSGAIPIPTKLSGMRNFLNALEKQTLLGRAVQIYPEAHIWPYFTGIRPFTADAFLYPIRFDVPAFASTITFQKTGKRKTPRITVFVDGPFYPDASLPKREQADRLRNDVYEAMKKRSESSTYAAIRYVKKERSTEG